MINPTNDHCLVPEDHEYIGITQDGMFNGLCLKCNHQTEPRIADGHRLATANFQAIVHMLTKARTKQKITREKMSLGVGFLISSIERGQVAPTARQLCRMADYLNVKINIQESDNANQLQRTTMDRRAVSNT